MRRAPRGRVGHGSACPAWMSSPPRLAGTGLAGRRRGVGPGRCGGGPGPPGPGLPPGRFSPGRGRPCSRRPGWAGLAPCRRGGHQPSRRTRPGTEGRRWPRRRVSPGPGQSARPRSSRFGTRRLWPGQRRPRSRWSRRLSTRSGTGGEAVRDGPESEGPRPRRSSPRRPTPLRQRGRWLVDSAAPGRPPMASVRQALRRAPSSRGCHATPRPLRRAMRYPSASADHAGCRGCRNVRRLACAAAAYATLRPSALPWPLIVVRCIRRCSPGWIPLAEWAKRQLSHRIIWSRPQRCL